MAKRILQGKRRAIRPFLFALHNFACHHLYRTRGNTVAGRRSPAQYCAKRSYTLSLSLPLYIYIYFSSLGRVLSNEISHTAVSLAHGSRYIQCAGHISATRDTLMKNHTANARTVGYRANISPGMRFQTGINKELERPGPIVAIFRLARMEINLFPSVSWKVSSTKNRR